MKFAISFFLTFFVASWAFCQPENARIEVRDGKSFYAHEVIQGNTLWGIQNLYKVKPEVILEHNPGVANGIKVGQIIYIPVQQDSADALPNPPQTPASGTMEVKNVVHVVAAGETVYGISRQYDIKPDDLLRLNPEAKNGLSIGQVLLIKEGAPQPNNPVQEPNPKPIAPAEPTQKPIAPREPSTVVIFTDSLVEHTVQRKETLYSISKRFMVSKEVLMQANNLSSDKIRHGDVLKIPLKKENFKSVPYREVPPVDKNVTSTTPTQRLDDNLLFGKKDQLRIAVLLPMSYGTSARSNGKTKAATQFYSGVKMALDTLDKMGLNAYVKLFDTRSDTASCLAVLEEMSKSKWDLVIGPLFNGPAELATKWAKDNRVPILMSTPTSPMILKMNPYVSTAIPSDQRMMEALAQHLAAKHAKDNIILVRSGSAEDDKNYEFFKNKINSLLGAGAYRKSVKEITGAPALSSAYVAGIKNVYVMLGKNKSSVMSFWTAFSSFQVRHSDGNNPNIILYGMREWEDWKEITNEQKSLLNFHYASATSWMPKSEGFQNFARQYRARYLAEPEKLAVQGYDAVHFFIRNYFMKNMTNYNAVMNAFNYVSTGDGHGMENSTVFIMKYADSQLMLFQRVQ